MASCESTGGELSFEWSHHRISSIDSKVTVTLHNPIKHSGSEGSERVNMDQPRSQGSLLPDQRNEKKREYGPFSGEERRRNGCFRRLLRTPSIEKWLPFNIPTF